MKTLFMIHRFLPCALAALSGLAAIADACTWKSTGRVNDWDWTEKDNFQEGVAPTAGDTVKLPASTDIFVTNAASFAVVAALDQVFTVTGARIIFGVPENETQSIDCAICSAAKHSESSSTIGEILKRGKGTLIFTRADGYPEQNDRAPSYTDRYAYCTRITCEEGTLRFPTSAETGGYSHFMGRLSVSNNATVFTVSGGNYTVPTDIFGDGVLTNDGTKTATLRVNGGRTVSSVFNGVIGGRIQYQSYGNVALTGTKNTFTGGFQAYCNSRLTNIDNLANNYSQTRLMKFGKKGEMATLPATLTDFQSYVGGGHITYIGDEADETDRNFNVGSPNDGVAVLDGGHHGELTLSGKFIMSTDSRYLGMAQVGLAGSNEYPCVIAGPVQPTLTNDFFFVKVGSGAWRFADTAAENADRTFATTLTLKEGTLQFDSLADAGFRCALGVSTNWSAAYYGGHTKAHVTNFAFLAGAAYGSARPATLEFTGDKCGIAVATRPIGLIGDLSLKNGTAKAWRFSGIANTTGKAVTLGLTGDGVATNELYGITDTATAPISVEKSGSGTWILDGSNTLHGAIAVKGGKLKVRAAQQSSYTWFRFSVRNKIGGGQYYMHFDELGIYDAEGNRLNLGLSTNNTDYASLEPGQIAFGRSGIAWWGSNNLLQIINGGSAYLEFRDANSVAPVPENPFTWLPFVMRLPKGSAAADTYDFCSGKSYNDSGNDKNRVIVGWSMEGSVDGVHWDLLSVTNNAQPLANVWVGSGVAYSGKSSDTTHLNGIKLARSGPAQPAAATVLDNVTTVSVAANATLEALGEMTLSAITLDALGNGTVKGFTFAASGAVDVVNLGENVKDHTFDASFPESVGLSNLMKWRLSVNGGPAASRQLVVTADGKVRLASRGTMVIFR